jgi:hypothetical protein
VLSSESWPLAPVVRADTCVEVSDEMSFAENPASCDWLKRARAAALISTTSPVDIAPIWADDRAAACVVLIAAMSDVASDAICLVVRAPTWAADIDEMMEVMKHRS